MVLLRKWEFKSSSDRFSPFFESSGPKQKGHNPYPLGHNVPPPAHIWVESYLKIVATTSTITVPSLMLLPQSAQFSYFFFLHHMTGLITALFINKRILKFKSQLTFPFFAAVNLSRPLRKQKFTSMGSKGHGLWYVIGGFRSVLYISVIQGSLLVIRIMIDGSEKHHCEGSFWTSEFKCFWKTQ